jgi:hypothetical protein
MKTPNDRVIGDSQSQFLEFESAEEKFNCSPKTSKKIQAKPDIHKPSQSALLERLQTFLPKISKANESIQDSDVIELEDSKSTNSDVSRAYIEMNLGLGVFEQKPTELDLVIPSKDDSVKGTITHPEERHEE